MEVIQDAEWTQGALLDGVREDDDQLEAGDWPGGPQ